MHCIMCCAWSLPAMFRHCPPSRLHARVLEARGEGSRAHKAERRRAVKCKRGKHTKQKRPTYPQEAEVAVCAQYAGIGIERLLRSCVLSGGSGAAGACVTIINHNCAAHQMW